MGKEAWLLPKGLSGLSLSNYGIQLLSVAMGFWVTEE